MNEEWRDRYIEPYVPCIATEMISTQYGVLNVLNWLRREQARFRAKGVRTFMVRSAENLKKVSLVYGSPYVKRLALYGDFR